MSESEPVLRLRRGLHVVAGDDEHVQVGLDPPARVIARRRPDVLAFLDRLVDGTCDAPSDPEAARLLGVLRGAGLLESAEKDDAGSGSVGVVDLGLGLDDLPRLLAAAGLRTGADPAATRLHVVGAAGPLPRAEVDRWLGDGAPHLVLAGTGEPGRLRLGPLVEPGVTACLRCVDAHESALDPRRPLILEQLAALPAPAVDPLLRAWAIAWAAREAAGFVAGRRPLTWSATIDLGGPAPRVRRWDRHPHCGCTWDLLRY